MNQSEKLMGGKLTHFKGRPVIDYWSGCQCSTDVTYRFSTDFENAISALDLFQDYLNRDGIDEAEGLVFGYTDSPYGDVTEDLATMLFANRCRLLGLKHLFWGDVDWNRVGDMRYKMPAPIFSVPDCSEIIAAFPGLETIALCGSRTSINSVRSISISSLYFDSNNLSSAWLVGLESCVFPNLKTLYITMGDMFSNETESPNRLCEFLRYFPFPSVKHLGIIKAKPGDEYITEILDSGIADSIDTLDLSYGTIGDRGARQLIESGITDQLEKLTIRHHFISEPIAEKLKSAGAAQVNLSDRQENTHGRFVLSYCYPIIWPGISFGKRPDQLAG